MNLKFSINPKLILVFLSVFLMSNSTVIFGTNNNYTFVQIGYVYLVMSSLYVLLRIRKFERRKRIVGIAMISLVLLTSLINDDFPMSNVIILLLIVNALLLSEYISLIEFVIFFDKILYFITILSLILSLMVVINKSMFSVFPTLTNSMNHTYRNLFLYVIEDANYGVFRNQSLFREPGVFQTYLSLGLLFQIFVLGKKSTKKIIIYFIALASTLSTTGYIAAGIYFIYLLGSNKVLKTRHKILTITAVVGVLTYLILFTDFLSNDTFGYSVFGKFANFRLIGNWVEIGGAAVVRIASVVMDIYIASQHLLFGYGANNVMDAYPQVSRMLYGTTLTYTTETFFLQAARFGIFYFMFWMAGYYRLAQIVSKKKTYPFIIAFVSLLVMIIAESYIYNILVYLLMFYGLFEHYDNNEIKIPNQRSNLIW